MLIFKINKQAFVTKDEAATGNDKAALLLGLLYDRSIGTSVNQAGFKIVPTTEDKSQANLF